MINGDCFLTKALPYRHACGANTKLLNGKPIALQLFGGKPLGQTSCGGIPLNHETYTQHPIPEGIPRGEGRPEGETAQGRVQSYSRASR